MNKLEVLKVVAKTDNFWRPDEIRDQILLPPERRSFYSYLSRLAGQGLLERGPSSRRRGKLTYRITERGLARIKYLRNHPSGY